ncbi:MAG: DUF61 family protein [Candidatus Hydrothermarchaeota archaeon]|nr:DUF61 family protein [Candidatus Hydrothermarchaeota archaeon]
MQDRTAHVISKQVQMLNRHLAIARRDLESLLREEKPKITLRDGSTHCFRKEELEKIGRILPHELHSKLMLPIYIELSDKYGGGTARVSGKSECKVIAHVLGKEMQGDELFIYKPELKQLRRELPTTTQYMFTLSLDY